MHVKEIMNIPLRCNPIVLLGAVVFGLICFIIVSNSEKTKESRFVKNSGLLIASTIFWIIISWLSTAAIGSIMIAELVSVPMIVLYGLKAMSLGVHKKTYLIIVAVETPIIILIITNLAINLWWYPISMWIFILIFSFIWLIMFLFNEVAQKRADSKITNDNLNLFNISENGNSIDDGGYKE